MDHLYYFQFYRGKNLIECTPIPIAKETEKTYVLNQFEFCYKPCYRNTILKSEIGEFLPSVYPQYSMFLEDNGEESLANFVESVKQSIGEDIEAHKRQVQWLEAGLEIVDNADYKEVK